MKTRWTLGILVVLGILGAVVKRHCDRLPAAVAPTESAVAEASAAEEAESKSEHSLEARLIQRVRIKLDNVPLKRAIEELGTQHRLNLLLDSQGLAEVGVSPDAPVSLSVENISLQSALRLLARQVGLGVVVRDEVVTLSSPAVVLGRLRQEIYDVADLVIPVQDNDGTEESFEPTRFVNKVDHTEAHLVKRLMETITATVDPPSWQARLASIQYVPASRALVVRAADDMHDEIRLLIASLRSLQDIEIALETRVVKLPSSLAESILEELGPLDGDAEQPTVRFLNDLKVKEYLSTVQAELGTSVLQTPKITVFNGQRAMLRAVDKVAVRGGDEKPAVLPRGYEIVYRPLASADRQQVRMQCELRLHHVEKESTANQAPHRYSLKVQRGLAVQAGRTALFSCGTVRESASAVPEWIRDVPGINWIARQVEGDLQELDVVMLVTPRIVTPSRPGHFLGSDLPAPMPVPAGVTIPAPRPFTPSAN